MAGEAYLLEGAGFVYPGSRPGFALDLDALRIGAGDTLAFVGPNGAGKTTLLMLLALVARPTKGRLAFFGEDPWCNAESVVGARRDVVLLTHHPYLFRGSVFDNVAFGLRLRKRPPAGWAAEVGRALGLVELAGWEARPVSGLSAGEAQRVALARALAPRPKVLLLDEPTANIEAGLAPRIEAVIDEYSRETGATVVLSTHNFAQAKRLAREVVYLSAGRRVAFSHENCFSGTARSDGGLSWIEPRPGSRIFFSGDLTGHVTCVIDPAAIRLSAAPAGAEADGPNVFAGRVTRMEITEPGRALIRVDAGITFRIAASLPEVEAEGVSLSRPVLIRFEPEAVALIASGAPGDPHHD